MSLRFALQPAVFGVTCHFETSASNDLKMTLSSNVPHIHVITNHEPQISLYALRPAVSYKVVTGHFDTSGPNDPRITLNIKRSKVLNIHVTTTPESHILLRFALSCYD